jgi:hypothetical protein
VWLGVAGGLHKFSSAAKVNEFLILIDPPVPFPSLGFQIDIHYERTAKRVNVKLLKETMWTELSSTAGPEDKENASANTASRVPGKQVHQRAGGRKEERKKERKKEKKERKKTARRRRQQEEGDSKKKAKMAEKNFAIFFAFDDHRHSPFSFSFFFLYYAVPLFFFFSSSLFFFRLFFSSSYFIFLLLLLLLFLPFSPLGSGKHVCLAGG